MSLNVFIGILCERSVQWTDCKIEEKKYLQTKNMNVCTPIQFNLCTLKHSYLKSNISNLISR